MCVCVCEVWSLALKEEIIFVLRRLEQETEIWRTDGPTRTEVTQD